MVRLLLLNVSDDFVIIFRISEAFTLDLLNVAICSLERVLRSLDLRHLSIDVLLESITLHVCGLVLLLKRLRLGSDFLETSGIIIVVFLKLLELSSLLKESFRSSSTLIFKDLLFLKVSTLCSLDELVSIVFVSHLKMIKSVSQSLDFLLTLSQFSIKLITISLKLFLLLSSLDDKVSLRVLSSGVLLPRARFVSLNETFVLDSQILDSRLSVLKLNSDFMPLFFSGFRLRDKDVFMDLNFLLPLLH
jgi:hypothetical protein